VSSPSLDPAPAPGGPGSATVTPAYPPPGPGAPGAHEPGTIGSLMEPAFGVFDPATTVAEAVERIRELVRTRLVTYGFIVDADQRLLGVVAMRDLLLADPGQRLDEIMLREPFSLRPDADLLDAMRESVGWHLPVYPVCEDSGRLVGLVRGPSLFEARAVEISAQAGRMVGVRDEERVDTPLLECLKRRHPWLQANLFTAFLAGAVIAVFQDTIDRLVLLAVFLPVLAGQCGNTGSQALAITLRGLTLGDLKPGTERRVATKEALLGLLNGAMVGVTAAVAMYLYATARGQAQAMMLGAIVFAAMTASCVVSGLTGVLVPLGLRRLGTDPATASSIVLSTATDVVSMALLLGLASWLIL
jgi:magnesium transporter